MAELTVRNRILETIREVLETLAGPAALPEGLEVSLAALLIGRGAHSVGLLMLGPGDAEPRLRAGAGLLTSSELVCTAALVIGEKDDLGVRPYPVADGQGWHLAVAFPAPGGTAALVARWQTGELVADHGALLEDAANSLRLALEREASERARQEAMALRTSQELQRQFLSSLSHELRTPLTAIRGYASSLLQPDVDWDGQSEQRFLNRISDESARLGRLVDDLLDFSAIDSGILRLQPDWCDLALVLEAARACLPETAAANVDLRYGEDLPVIWADHDRLEQVFVNLFDNAVRHNHPGTKVAVSAAPRSVAEVEVEVVDDGEGVSDDEIVGRPAGRKWRRSRTAGAGLGLSIARGIVSAHGGRLDIERTPSGTRCRVSLPVALGAPPADVAGDG
jgi:signal transduction histidine kinase